MPQLDSIIAGLRSLASFLEEECAQSPAFTQRLQLALTSPPATKAKAVQKKAKAKTAPNGVATAFDLAYRSHAKTGGEAFRTWLLSQDAMALKAIIKREGLDPGKATRSWKNTNKLADLIMDRTATRMKRGSAFLPPKAASTPPVSSKAKKNKP